MKVRVAADCPTCGFGVATGEIVWEDKFIVGIATECLACSTLSFIDMPPVST